MNDEDYACRANWSPEDGEHVGLCEQLPSLSWLAASHDSALAGIRRLIAEVACDLEPVSDQIPVNSRRKLA
jgi:hypothetical protein